MQILPTENSNESVRRKRSADFNGMIVSYPQYIRSGTWPTTKTKHLEIVIFTWCLSWRLMKLQDKAVKLDNIMRKLAEGKDPAQLTENSKWKELVSLRQSLQKLLPRMSILSGRKRKKDIQSKLLSKSPTKLTWLFFSWSSFLWRGTKATSGNNFFKL